MLPSRARLSLLLAVLLPFVTACEPCAGVSTCTDGSRFVLIGQVVQPFTANAAPGVTLQVTVTRDGDTLGTRRIVTDADGMWEFRIDAAEGPALAHVRMLPVPADSFDLPAFGVHTVLQGGDATILPPWYSRPFTHLLRSVARHPTLAPVVGAEVTFEPTGGVPTTAASYTAVTNGAGVFEFSIQGATLGNVIGRLVITHADFYTIDIPDAIFEIGHVFAAPAVQGTYFYYD